MSDLISRAAAIDAAETYEFDDMFHMPVYRELVSVDDLRKLPPAQQKVNINLNEYIKVKLTDLGKDIYYHQFDSLNKAYGKEICKPAFPKEDENGYTKFQLWNFIELYGRHIGMTKPSVIRPLEIVYGLDMREEKKDERSYRQTGNI